VMRRVIKASRMSETTQTGSFFARVVTNQAWLNWQCDNYNLK